MARAAIASAGVIELGGIGLGIADQVGQGGDVQAERGVGVHHQHIGHAHHLRDGGKVGGGVIRHLAVQPRVDRMGGHCGNADGQTVGRCLGNRVCADIAARAGPVFNDDRAQRIFHALGYQSGGHVDRATRRIRHDQADDFG